MKIAQAWNNFAKQLSASMGSGGVRVTLHLHTADVPNGGDAVGTLRVQGGVTTQHIEKLTVRLAQVHGEGENAQWKTLCDAVIATHINIAPDQIQEYAFRLPVPFTALLSSGASSAQISARANIRRAINRGAHVYVKVTPPGEIMTLDAALQQLGFTPKQYNFVAMRPPHSASVTKSYHAPHALSSQITGATLYLWLETDYAGGTLTLHHAKTGLKDILRAARGEDRQSFTIGMPRSLLAGKSGTTDAKTRLKSLLDQALILPDNQANWMLRAANAPADAGTTLLRAAAPTLETNPEQLLHASDNTDL